MESPIFKPKQDSQNQLWNERVNNDGQEFHQCQQNEQLHLTSTYLCKREISVIFI